MESYNRLLEHNIKPSMQRIAIMNYLMEHKTRSKAHIADGLRGDHRITEKAPFKESSLKGALRFCD